MKSRHPNRRLAAVLALLGCAAAHAQDEAAAPIPWAYSAFFGTGAYQIAGEETYVVRYGPRWEWREPALDEEHHRRIGVEFRFPISLGVHTFDPAALGETLAFDNLSTLTVVPGVEIEIPVAQRWSLKPFGYVGWGSAMDGSSSAWVYWTGLKSELRFAAKSFDWALLNELTYSGFSDDQGQHNSVLPLFTALEFDRPLASKQLRGERVHLYWHVGYTEYLNQAELFMSNSTTVQVDNEWEVGMAFGTGAEPLRLWRLKWDRVGVSYRFSSDREFQGIGLYFHSLFDR